MSFFQPGHSKCWFKCKCWHLRFSAQQSTGIYTSLVIPLASFVKYFRILIMDFVFQFQALRAMVQANPQILQVLSSFLSIFFFYMALDEAKWWKSIHVAEPKLLGDLRQGLVWFSFFCEDWWHSLSIAAYASGAGKAKSALDAANSGASSRLSKLDQWTRWGGGVRWHVLVLHSVHVVGHTRCGIISLSFWAYIWCRFSFVCDISNVLEQLAGAMPQTVAVTPEEREAIERVS